MVRKAFRFNAALEAQRRAHLATNGLDRFAASGRAVTPSPGLSLRDSALAVIASVDSARHVRINNLIHVWFSISNPQGGAAGAWHMDLPFQPAISSGVNNIPIGQWVARQSGPATTMDGWVNISANGPNYYASFATRNTAGPVVPSFVGPTYPWNWALLPGLPVWRLGGWFSYEVADAYSP